MSRFGLLPTFRPGPLGRPVFCGGPEDAGVRVRWLGTACFVVSTKSTTVVVDPFVSRPALRDVAFRRLVPDGVEVRRRFPAKVDAVVCGHAHYDHAMDAPTLALATGAKFVGSVTAAHLARASGVPEEQLCVVSRLGETVKVGDIEHPWLRGYVPETALGRVKLGQKVRITTDSYPGKTYEGRITFIASEAEFTPKQIQTEEERVKLVYRIKVDVDNRARELKSNMPADAVIVLEQ